VPHGTASGGLPGVSTVKHLDCHSKGQILLRSGALGAPSPTYSLGLGKGEGRR
jgi:hypothetical protein